MTNIRYEMYFPDLCNSHSGPHCSSMIQHLMREPYFVVILYCWTCASKKMFFVKGRFFFDAVASLGNSSSFSIAILSSYYIFNHKQFTKYDWKDLSKDILRRRMKLTSDNENNCFQARSLNIKQFFEVVEQTRLSLANNKISRRRNSTF